MNISMKKKYILWSLGLIALLTGLGFYVLYEIKVYNTLLIQAQRINVLDDFLSSTFKEQVKIYVDAKKAGTAPVSTTPTPLPTNDSKK